MAITGAMSTEIAGFPSWKELAKKIADCASDVLEAYRQPKTLSTGDAHRAENARSVVKGQIRLLRADKPSDVRVIVAIVRDAFRELDWLLARSRGLTKVGGGFQPPSRSFDERIATLFVERVGPAKGTSTIGALINSLGVKRFATLNYDLELERALMASPAERKKVIGKARGYLSLVQGLEPNAGPPLSRDDQPIRAERTRRLSRVLGDGKVVESDILNRERPDRLLEFAIGSAEADRHIIHLHGRLDEPHDLVLDIRDYDRLYRLDDLYRNPFEHGLRVLLAGNPVLFVGLGMSEPEINEKLQYFVSNSPAKRMAPAFLLWNTVSDPRLRSDDGRAEKRRDFLLRLGVHVIYDADLIHSDQSWVSDSIDRIATVVADLEKAKEKNDQIRVEEAQKEKRQIELRALGSMIEQLPRTIEVMSRRATDLSSPEWRSIRQRVKCRERAIVRMWGTPALIRKVAADFPSCKDADAPCSTPDEGQPSFERLLVAVSKPGFGRGEFSEVLIQTGDASCARGAPPGWRLCGACRGNRLLANAGFSYDSDALLNGLKEYLAERTLASDPIAEGPREVFFSEPSAFKMKDNRKVLIVINGIDRFFGLDGVPLSAELDHLLRCVANTKSVDSHVQWVLLGTERIRRYFQALCVPVSDLSGGGEVSFPGEQFDYRSRYLNWVAEQFQKEKTSPTPADSARLREAKALDREALRRAFFASYLSPLMLESAKVDSKLAYDVLRTLAFIGSPVEAGVLLHAPLIAARLARSPRRLAAQRLLMITLTKLSQLGLVLRVAKFDDGQIDPVSAAGPGVDAKMDSSASANGSKSAGQPVRDAAEITVATRFGLHRSLAMELRDRHGVPISESKLATTFNMSLFVAQPGESYVPEPHFHEELGELVDRLIGAWRDVKNEGQETGPTAFYEASKLPSNEVVAAATGASGGWAGLSYETKGDSLPALCSRTASTCLRAAFNVIRNYYSTTGLLTFDERGNADDRQGREGRLSEHAERLDRLLSGHAKMTAARTIYRNLRSLAVDLDKANQELGPEPFYADDLVWLHNERAVVKLVQGNLYDARRSLSLANRANIAYLEKNHRGQNWRRITINLIGLLIERGNIQRAESRIDEINESIEQARWVHLRHPDSGTTGYGERSDTPSWPKRPDLGAETQAGVSAGREALTRPSRVRQILEDFGSESLYVASCESPEFSREEILSVALVTGYRGLVAHTAGKYGTAKELYLLSTTILRRLGEQRAYALFQRHYASLHRTEGDGRSALQEIEYAIVAADSVQQMDIAHRSRILRAAAVSRSPATSETDRRGALQEVQKALQYSVGADVYRVRIEADECLAREMRLGGDYDTALRYAADALATACRYGHSLHKVSLRIEIGQILVQRGDPMSGRALIETAIASAARHGNHRAVERAQRALRRLNPGQGRRLI